MHAAGWVGMSWPKEYGGRGAGFMQQVIFDEEYFRARAPVLPSASGLNLLGPTLIHWGTEEQKQRHLPRILNADELWCQGYSEPDAGGDLASLRTRASTRATISSSTARRCGPREHTLPIGVFCWCAPIPRRRSITASAICWST